MRLNPAIYGIFALTTIMVGRIQEIFPLLWNLHLAKIAFIATILALIFASENRYQKPLTSFPQINSLLLLYALGLVSSLFGYWPSKSLGFMLTSFLSSLVYLLLFIVSIRNELDLHFAVFGAIFSVAAISVFTISDFRSMERAMVEGTAYDPNDLATVMVIFLPLIYFATKEATGLKRLALIGIGVSSILSILATQSRGGFIGLIFVILVLLIRERVHFVNILIIAIASVPLFIAFTPPAHLSRLSTLLNPSQDYNFTDKGGRIAIWKRGIGFMVDNPVLGVGPAVFYVAEGKSHGGEGKWSVAHNSFLQVGGEFGVFGLILFTGAIVSCIKQLRRLRHRLNGTGQAAKLASAIEIGFYGYIITGLFLSQAFSSTLFLLIGISTAITSISVNEQTLCLSGHKNKGQKISTMNRSDQAS